MASEKMRIPQHCGKDMKWVQGRATAKSFSSLNVSDVFRCQQQGCKHEEIITKTVADYDPDTLKRAAEVIGRQRTAFEAGAAERKAMEDHYFREMKEREDNIKSIMDRHRERGKMGFWAHLFAKD